MAKHIIPWKGCKRYGKDNNYTFSWNVQNNSVAMIDECRRDDNIVEDIERLHSAEKALYRTKN